MAKANGVADQAALLQSGYDTALKNATGSVEALQITIGSALLPVLTKLLNDVIAPGINWLTGFADALFGNQKAFDDLGATAQAAVGVFQNIGKVFIGAFDFFAEGKLDNLFSGLTALFGGPAAGAIVDFADQIKTVFTAIPSIAAGALATLQGIVTAATGAILSAWSQYGSQILAAAQATWTTVATTVNTAVAVVATIVSGVLSTVVGFWAQYGGQIIATVTTTWGSIQTTVAAVITAMVPVVQGVLAQIATFWATNGAAIQATVATVWGQIGSVVQAATGFIQASVIPALAAIGSFIASHGTEIQAAMTGVWTNIRTSITSTLSGIQGVITGATQIIQGNWMAGLSSLASGTASILTGILAQFGLKLSDLSGVVQMQFQAVTMAGVTAMGALESSLAAGWNAIYAATIGKVTAMVSGVVASFAQQNPEIVGKLQQASASIGQIWGAIETRIGAAVGSLVTVIGGGFEQARSVAVAAMTALQSVLGTVWGGIERVIATVVTTIASLIGVKFDEAHTSASTAMGGILSTISGMVGSFASAAAAIGKAIIDGIAGGIRRGASTVANAALDAANNALNSAKGALGINSPSEVAAAEIGVPFVQGIGIGIISATPFAVGAANVSAQTILAGAHEPIAAGAPLLGQTLMQGLAVGLDANLSSAENVTATAAQGLIINTTGMLGASAQTIGQSLMGGTATGITAAAPVLFSSITATMDQATGKATETLGGAAATTVGAPFAKGVAAGIFQNKGVVTDAASGLMQDTTLSARDILKIGGESSQTSADLVGSPFGAGVAQGIADAAPAVGDAAKVVGEAGADTLPTALQPAITDSLKIVTDAKPSFVSAGKNLIAGMTEGVKAAAGALAAAAAAAARAALDAAQSELGIHSPSTEAAVHVGAPFVAGVGQGIASAVPDLEKIATDMASAAIGSAHAGLSTRDAQTLGTTITHSVGQGIANSNTESYWQKQIRLRDERLASLNTGGASFDLSEIDPGNLDKALGQMADIAKIVGAWAKKQTIDPGVAKKFAETTKIVSDAVSATVTLRQLLMDLGEPADLTAVAALVNELATILGVFQTQIGKNKLNVGLLKAYAEATSQAIGVIKTMLDARKGLSDPGPPIDMDIVAQLALEARIITRIVQTELVKYAQEERDAMAQEAAIVGSVVDIFKHVLDLRSAFQDPGPPIMLDRLLALADEANAMVVLLEQTINPAARAEQDQLAAFAANVQKTVDTFKAVLDLRKGLADPQMPISPAALQSLAADTDLLVQTAASLVPEGFALIDGLEAYASTAEKAESIFKGMADLRGSLATVAAPIDQQVVDQLAGELRKVVIRFYTDAIPLGTDLLNASQQYSTVAGQATSSIKGMVDLRAAIATIGPPVDLSVVDRLAGELRKVVIRFYTDAIPFAQQTVQAVDAYHAVAGNAISSLTDAAKLGTVLSAPSPIPLDVVKTLTGNLAAVVTLFVGGVIHYAQDLADQVSRYTAIAGNAITTIGNVAKLGSDLKDAPPIPMGIVKEMAASAVAIADLFTNTLIVYAEQTETDATRYASISGNAIKTISDIAKLGKDLQSASPISDAVIIRAIADAQRITALFETGLLPASEDQATAATHTASVVSDSVKTIKDVLSLPGTIFTEYVSPSDAQIKLAISDAERLFVALQTLAQKYSAAGTEATGAMADSIGKVASALSGIKTMVMDINPGANFTMNTDQLEQFQQSAGQLIWTAGQLGALAVDIPTAGLDAIVPIANAMNALFASLGKGGAIDWGAMGGNATMSSGYSGPVAPAATVQPAMTGQQIANAYYYSNTVTIGSFSAQNGVSRTEVQGMIMQAMNASGRTAYTRQRTA
jgi:phage-related protein